MCLLYIHIGMQLLWPYLRELFWSFSLTFVISSCLETVITHQCGTTAIVNHVTMRRLRELEVSNRKPHCLALARFLRDFLGLKNVFLISVATREWENFRTGTLSSLFAQNVCKTISPWCKKKGEKTGRTKCIHLFFYVRQNSKLCFISFRK